MTGRIQIASTEKGMEESACLLLIAPIGKFTPNRKWLWEAEELHAIEKTLLCIAYAFNGSFDFQVKLE